MAGEVAARVVARHPDEPGHRRLRRVGHDGGRRRLRPEPERVAVFDNDGTLWTEKPIPIQLDFTLFRMAEQATPTRASPITSRTRRRSTQDYHWLGATMVKHYHGDDTDMGLLLAAVSKAFEGMDVEDFAAEVRDVVRDRRPPGAATAAT